MLEAKELFEREADTLVDQIVVFTICEHLTKAGNRVEADEIRRKFGKSRGLSERRDTQYNVGKVSFSELLIDAKRTGDYQNGMQNC